MLYLNKILFYKFKETLSIYKVSNFFCLRVSAIVWKHNFSTSQILSKYLFSVIFWVSHNWIISIALLCSLDEEWMMWYFDKSLFRKMFGSKFERFYIMVNYFVSLNLTINLIRRFNNWWLLKRKWVLYQVGLNENSKTIDLKTFIDNV